MRAGAAALIRLSACDRYHRIDQQIERKPADSACRCKASRWLCTSPVSRAVVRLTWQTSEEFLRCSVATRHRMIWVVSSSSRTRS